jgi:alanine dehydrogenase
MGLIVLQDPETGYPLAIMDGVHITTIRTGAVVGVAAEYFASPEVGVAAFVGAGAQASTALEALVLTRRPASVTVYDVDPDRAASFAAAVTKQHDLEARACGTIEDAVTGAWLITTATPADAPLVEGRWIAPGATSVSLGSFQEFSDDAVMGADRIVVDSWEQCAHRGELKRFAESGRLTRQHIHGEIGDTVGGGLSGRDDPGQRILVVPIGLGTHDLYLARMVLDRASTEPLHTFDFVNVQ